MKHNERKEYWCQYCGIDTNEGENECSACKAILDTYQDINYEDNDNEKGKSMKAKTIIIIGIVVYAILISICNH